MEAPSRKILIYSIAYYPFVGGAETAIKEITDRIKEVEWHMVTCLFDKTLPREEVIGNVHVYRVNCPKIFFPFVSFVKGIQLQRKNNYAVVWSMMTFAGFSGLFFKLFFPNTKFLLSLQEGTPLSEIKRKAFVVYPLFWFMFKKADMIQAISHFLAGFGRDMGHTKDVVVIPNGVDLTYFSKPVDQNEREKLQKKIGKKEGDIYLITTSRLVKKNAIDNCIQALAYLPAHVSLLIIGIGEEEEKLRCLARDLGLRDRVKFLGFMPQRDIPTFLTISDVFVRPSRSEGLGNSFIEAMAAGIPVVATPVGGIPDFLDDHETGIFCRPDNPKSLAEAILEIIDNPSLREKIVRQAKERALARYGWDTVVKEMKEKVFELLIQKS